MGREKRSEFRLVSGSKADEMMQREDIVRMVPSPSHEHHTRDVGVMLQISTELLFTNLGSDG
jgi:hypothetical protein